MKQEGEIMKKQSQRLGFAALLLMFLLGVLTGCFGEAGQSQTSSVQPDQTKASTNGIISASELKSVLSSADVSLADDSPASRLWVPKNRTDTLGEVMGWLAKAKTYNGQIPKSQVSGAFAANIGPAVLYITTDDNHKINLKPAYYLAASNGQTCKVCYVADVLQIQNDNQICYIQSSQLYDWLKNDQWKTEFELKQD